MTHPLQPTNCIAVEVPQGSHHHSISYNGKCLFYREEQGFHVHYHFSLPGTYTLIGIWPEMTEEQAREVVEGVSALLGWNAKSIDDLPKAKLYMNYLMKPPVPVKFLFTNPAASLASLLASNSLDPSKRYAILKPI